MIDEKKLREIMPFAARNIQLFVPWLIDAFEKFGINTPAYQAAFIAQVAHESGSFNYVKEIASGKAYDTGTKAKALGNTPEADGDGQKYKGRGLIQITGRTNYKACSLALFGDTRLLDTPEILETPQYAVYSACWFWQSRRLNVYVNQNDFVGLTKRINGGINGLADRQAFWERAKRAFC